MKEKILKYYGNSDEIIFAEGFDDAIYGFDPNAWRVVYSRNECVKIMVKRGMYNEDAIDFLEYNTFNAFIGEKTPIWAETFDWD